MIAPKLLRAVPIGAIVMFVGVSTGTASPFNFRSYISSSGNDANPCTLQQQCRLLPRALAMTAPNGEIWMLDSANYNTGPVLISIPVSILAIPGAVGSLVATGGGDALDINVPPGTTGGVRLNNLVFRPFGSSFHDGIALESDTNLTIDNCKFIGPLANALEWTPTHVDLDFPPSGPGVLIRNSQISGAINGITVDEGPVGNEAALLRAIDVTFDDLPGFGINFQSGGTLNLDHVHLFGNGPSLSSTGIELATAGTIAILSNISNSVISGFNIGVHATQTGPTVTVAISNSEIKESGTAVQSNGALIGLYQNRLFGNATAISASAPGTVRSAGFNLLLGNPSSGSAPGTIPLE